MDDDDDGDYDDDDNDDAATDHGEEGVKNWVLGQFERSCDTCEETRAEL